MKEDARVKNNEAKRKKFDEKVDEKLLRKLCREEERKMKREEEVEEREEDDDRARKKVRFEGAGGSGQSEVEREEGRREADFG